MHKDNKEPVRVDPGVFEKNGHWRPANPQMFSPVFKWPWNFSEIIKWLFGFPGIIWPQNLIYVILAFATYYFLQPDFSKTTRLEFWWIGLMLLRNFLLILIVYGIKHLALYTLKLQGTERKYNPNWQIKGSKRFLFANQVYDNAFRTLVSGLPIWTAYEVLYVWAASNGKVPYLVWSEHPVLFVAMFPLIFFWRDLHFYTVHRMIHWGPLMRHIHSVHHKNPNPGPWSGLSMHPIEHLIYFSVAWVHFVIPSHPAHFLFNIQHAALTPAAGHNGFEKPILKGSMLACSYHHYLHHKHVACNFGTGNLPLDKWFGNFYDGTGEYKIR